MTSQLLSANPFTPQTWLWQNHQITYTVQGQGLPLVLLHGFGGCIGHWRKNIPTLAQAGYQVFALDLLGFGASDKPALTYSLDLWYSLLQDFWETHIQQPSVWIGNSIGGLLSLMILSRSPERGKAGVLINCAGGLNHRPEELNFPLRIIMGGFTHLVSSPLTGPLMFNQVRQKHRIRRTLHQVYMSSEAITDELVDLLYQPSCDPGAQQVFASVLTAPPGPKPEELLPQVKQPLLVLWGENDPWTPIAGAKLYRRLAQSRADVEFISIPNAGHCPHDEYPDLVNRLILRGLTQF
ncbi:alpha/beta fold hydrolase [Roseofilum capinflatum]|uniref:Alpha/beta fold hydrolase n=1 Tax=Roseofilum capinflatum BLCC-M114 TaxID=3022440 RepID=A0ABT7BBJ7_9CYAN|nr:alpha/beta fold hydrolase [Roseofilum capinflatum]MDJ1176545.1 alpha/beta fold hydrolase [Roseofilum capinflatum BLCC-M114]